MKKLFFKLTCTFVLFFCLLYQTFGQLPCNNWLNVNGSALRSGVEIGDLDISGDKLTVEAQVNANYIDPRYYGGDIVSKHQDPFACNYLLRGERAEITTSAGYYATPPVCGLELNKTYHIAMVYDGSYLKYYRNGFLMSQVSCTGNVILNNWQTLIGATAGTESTLFTGFYGYINEVRIWNVARTQNEIKQYMDKSLPNPATQTGLLAYYTFDDLLNKQGNAVWDGALISPATINQANPQCSFVADSCKVVNVSAAFSAPDTVCVDSTLKVTNTSTGATTYNWSFCAPTVNAPVSGMNMGSFGGAINDPVFQDIAKDDNGNFYGLVAQHYPATIVRLNYGNSLLNTPTVENLGNFGGAIPNQTEGIKIIKEGNTWYAFVVGGNNELPNSSPRIVKLDFGNSLANNAVATNWGNISNSLNFPTELFIAKESGNYYGYTLNLADNSLVRINFGNNFSSAPTAINLGNPGNYFDYPTGFDFVNENGNWYCFEINELSENLIRLDFGNSLLNSPSAVNLGNPGNNFIRPRDVAIINTCSGIFGYVVNGHGAPINGSLVQLDFGTDILSTPGAVNLGDPAGFRLPHSFTHFFHIDNDMYTFIQNNDGNSIIRLKFSGCANATPSSSILQNPPPVKYSSPGLYNIILTVDIGLPTETSACKQIEVKDCAPPIVADFTITDTVCVDSTLKIKNTSSGATTYNWSFCAPDTNAPLTGTNLGNISSVLSNPVFQDIVKGDDGNYYGFMTNHNPGTLIRLDYGNSLLNTPTAITLGNFGDVIPNQAEGIQVIKEGGNWYAIIVGGGNTGVNSSPRIIKLDFGSLITNTSPTATNWGNIGSMQFPHGLAIHKDGDRYYGFAVDAFCNCIIKFDFGNNFSSPPAGTNFGNVGNLSTPSGIYFVNNSGSWYAFVTNRTSNSLTRLSFGTSLSNTPTGINIGNPGNTLIVPGDIIINNTCSGIFGYVVNAQGPPGNGSIVKLDFGTDILNTPAATNQGDAGNFSFPHSFTSLFYEGNDLYTFIPNAGNNTLSRVKISGCTNASPSSSILQNPPPVKYSSPGLYNIILTVDIGLPTETSACKQIEVKDCFNPCTGFTIDAGKDTTICPGTSVQLNATGASAFDWNRSP